MVLYLAGNFVTLTNLDKERALKDTILARGKEYHRLVSYYYPKTVDTVLTLKKEEMQNDSNGTIRDRLSSGKKKRRKNVKDASEKVSVDEKLPISRRRSVQTKPNKRVSRSRTK